MSTGLRKTQKSKQKFKTRQLLDCIQFFLSSIVLFTLSDVKYQRKVTLAFAIAFAFA